MALMCVLAYIGLTSIRQQGHASIEDIEAVVLEANSDFSVIARSENQSDSALANVHDHKSQVDQDQILF